uniref:Uncharacterized protein n=1 Tax=Aegilops tauschii TaxID=37682 RepID=M8BM64_AEGTA
MPETVIITDMKYYPVSHYHFDLSGTAIAAVAKAATPASLMCSSGVPGADGDILRGGGVEPILHMAILVEYENSDGDVNQLDIMESR